MLDSRRLTHSVLLVGEEGGWERSSRPAALRPIIFTPKAERP